MADPVPPQSPPPGSGGGPVQFGPRSVARIEAVTQYVERFYRGTPNPFSHGRGGVTPATIARITTTLPAAVASTYGTGQGYLQIDSGSALSDDTATGHVDINNLFDKTVVSGSAAYVVVVFALGSWWATAPSSCSILV